MHGEYHEGPMQAITMLRRLKSSSNYTLTRATSILPHVPRKTALEAAKIYMCAVYWSKDYFGVSPWCHMCYAGGPVEHP